MVCQKCRHKNEAEDKFCSACGEKLHKQVVQTKVPIWVWLVLIISCMMIGGISYGFWDYFNEEKSVHNYKEVSSDAGQIEQTEKITFTNNRASNTLDY